MIHGTPAKQTQLSLLLQRLDKLLFEGLSQETSYPGGQYKNAQTEALNQAGKIFLCDPNEDKAITLQQELDVMKGRGKRFKFDEIGQVINEVLNQKRKMP